MSQLDYYRTADGTYLGAFDTPPSDAIPCPPPEDARSRWDDELGWLPVPTFLPIEPVPFWDAAWDLFRLKKSDVLDAIQDPDERYSAELRIDGRKTYLRDDDTVVRLSTLLGYPEEQMDDLWLYVQANYE